MTTESSPVATPVTTRPQSRLFVPAVVAANFGTWLAFFTPVTIPLPLKAAQLAPDDKTAVLSLVLAVGSVCGLLANPLVGRLSDRTTSSWGMRRPWLLGGAVCGFGGLVVMALSTSVPVLLLGSILVQVGFAATLTVVLALLPDQVRTGRSGLVAGLLGVGQSVGLVVGATLAATLQANPLLSFTVPGLIGVAAIGGLCVIMRDRVLPKAERAPLRWSDVGRSYWRSPRRYPDYGWAWLSRFLLFLSFSAVINYQVFYLSDQIGVPPAEATGLSASALGLQTVVVMITSAVAGALSDRVRRRKPFVVVAGLLGALGLTLLALATTVPAFLGGIAVSAVSLGVYFSVDIALVREVLPDADRDAARDFGLMAVAGQLPQVVSPALAPVLLAVAVGSVAAGAGHNYTVLFLAGAACAVASAVLVTRIRSAR